MRQSRVSLCMIVRDEEEFLDACLTAAAPFIDEICLVDTGSRDRTLEIAQRHGARIKTIEWPEDFSAARNVSLEMADGDWVLMLDADEVLDAAGLEEFDRFVDRETNLAGNLLIRNHYKNERRLDCFVMRLWRHDDRHRFCNVIHEQVGPSVLATQAQRGGLIMDLSVALDHYGYHEDLRSRRAKDERDRPLFERAVAQRPQDGYLWFKYGDFLRRSDDVAAVEEALAQAASLARAMPDAERRAAPWAGEAHALLALSRLNADAFEEAEELLDLAFELTTETPMMFWVRGHQCLRQERWEEAEEAFAACQSFDGRPQHMPAQPEITSSRSWFGLARAQLGRGAREEASAKFVEGADRWPECADLVRAAARVELAQRDTKAAMHRITNWLGDHPEDSEAWAIGGEVLLECGLFERASTFAERAIAAAKEGGESRPARSLLGECQCALGRFEAALEAWAEAPLEPRSRVGTTLLCLALGESTPAWIDPEAPDFAPWARQMLMRLEKSPHAADFLARVIQGVEALDSESPLGRVLSLQAH